MVGLDLEDTLAVYLQVGRLTMGPAEVKLAALTSIRSHTL